MLDIAAISAYKCTCINGHFFHLSGVVYSERGIITMQRKSKIYRAVCPMKTDELMKNIDEFMNTHPTHTIKKDFLDEAISKMELDSRVPM